MKRTFLLPLLAALGLSFAGCQKEQSEAERTAEIERQVQQRLAAERTADEQARLAQRSAELDAREQALEEERDQARATPAQVATSTPAPRAADNAGRDDEAGSASYATFYRKLDPYGDWMETGDYGYVFQPRAANQSRDWRPYTNGHWVYTDAGWTWISDEPFGWATYHYGRWIRLRSVGWVWVPGEQWAPAWVSWRKGNDYVGWAPLPPEAQFNRETGIRNWADNYYDIGPEQYAFVPAIEFGRKLSPREILPPQRNLTIINQTINVTNITYSNSVIVDRGPSYEDLRARSRQPIERLRLERTQNLNFDRPVIRGEVVALPALDFQPAARAARPNRVTRNLAQPVVERGWSGIQDQQAAEKARTKMKAEATPPPNLPPKKFVRPENRQTNPSRPAPANVGTPAATATPVSTPAVTATPRPTRPATRPRLTPTPAPSATPVATTPPNEPATPAASATPGEPVQPSPAENIYSPKEADRNRRQQAQEEKRKARKEAQAQRQTEREQKMLERKAQKARPAEATATPEATAAPEATATDSPTARPAESPDQSPAQKERNKRGGKKGRKGTTPTEPSASPAPTAQQP